MDSRVQHECEQTYSSFTPSSSPHESLLPDDLDMYALLSSPPTTRERYQRFPAIRTILISPHPRYKKCTFVNKLGPDWRALAQLPKASGRRMGFFVGTGAKVNAKRSCHVPVFSLH